MKHSDFWQGDRGILNIKPKRVGELWESYDTIALITRLVGDNSVVEVGCGQGRFSRSFASNQYIGVDINPAAIEIAERENPDYNFDIIKDYDGIPNQDVMLLHSVALHVPDEEINELFSHANKRIVLAETMGERRVRQGEKPADLAFHYARSAADYKKLLSNWNLVESFTKQDTNSNKIYTYMVFEND